MPNQEKDDIAIVQDVFPANPAAELPAPDGAPADQDKAPAEGKVDDPKPVPSPPPRPRRRAGILAEWAGYIVMSLSAIAILWAFFMLMRHVNLIESKIPTSAFSLINPDCGPASGCSDQIWRIGLESNAQYLRTERVLSMLSIRITLFIFGEIVALTMCVAGGVLILNRIETSNGGNSNLTWQQLSLTSTFPGLLLCGLGALIIWATLYYATRPESQVTIFDYPVYVADTNAGRNLAGVVSGMRPGTTLPKSQSASASSNDAALKAIEALTPSNTLGK